MTRLWRLWTAPKTEAPRAPPAYAEPVQCPTCSVDVADDARFCSSCGTELARRADERRLVTVLFADIVGFTGLSETRDPEQVKNLVDRCFARLADDITAFGGRVDKVVGDAIIALFGAPTAHEDDAERAVRAALMMQETVEGFDGDVAIRVRIGVNTGEVLVGGLAAGDDYTAMGDVVNTASRLQTAAEPGTVLVGPATHEATAEVVHYRSMGHIHARGREESVATWRALEPVGRPGERRDGPATHLIGREPELAILRRAVVGAYRRGRAQLLTLTGESGLGKGRLASEIAAFARDDHDAIVLEGRCLPYGEANIWWPIAQAVRGVVGIDVDVADDAARVAVHDAVERALGPSVEPDEVDRTTEGLLHLLGHASALAPLDPERATAEGIRSALAFVHGLAQQAPVVITLRDLQWADDAVLRLLDHLLDRLGRRPLVLVVTSRPGLVDRWQPSPRRFNAFSLTLDPLDDSASRLLSHELLPDIDDETRDGLVERAGGNPLFLHEMARMISERGDASGALPANVRSVISARLDSLDDGPRILIEDAAVLGLRGPVEALHRMAEYMDLPIDVEASITALEQADLLETPGDTWSFRSNLVREVAYGRITKTERAVRHAGIAGWIEARAAGRAAEIIAFHYRRAATLARELGGIEALPDDLADRAIEWTVRAARETKGATAIERSQQLFGEAIALMAADDPRRAEVLLEQASVAVRSLRMDDARRDLAEAAPLVAASSDPRLGVRQALLASEIARWRGDQEAALAAAERALGIAETLDEPGLVADGLRQRGMAHLFRDQHDDARQSFEAALDAYARAEDPAGMAWARQNLAWIAFVRGDMVAAETRLADATAAFEQLGDQAGIMWSRGLLAYVRIHAGRFDDADVLARRTLAESRERGDTWGQGMMSIALATSALWTGRVDEALQRATQARVLFPEGSDPLGSVQATAVEGRSLVVAGRVVEGMRMLHDGYAATVPGDNDHEMLRNAIASAAAAVGDVASAWRMFDESDGLDPDRLGESDRAVAVALTHLHAGDPLAAVRLADLVRSPRDLDDDEPGFPWAWAVLALAVGSTGGDATLYTEAVERSARATYADRALARAAAACAAARRGDEAAAREALASAVAAVPEGGDRLHPAVIAVARAECLAALGTEDAAEAAARADRAVAALGVDPVGWHTVFARACGRATVPADR